MKTNHPFDPEEIEAIRRTIANYTVDGRVKWKEAAKHDPDLADMIKRRSFASVSFKGRTLMDGGRKSQARSVAKSVSPEVQHPTPAPAAAPQLRLDYCPSCGFNLGLLNRAASIINRHK